jgi:AbiV family abortive infection protein
LALRNSLRLHNDAIALFNYGSYPSSYFLSILSLEEIGKVNELEDLIFYSFASGRIGEKMEQDALKSVYDHKNKQAKFFRHAREFDPLMPKYLKALWKGELERQKQNSVYVGLARAKGKIDLKGRINSPFTITRKRAQEQITTVNDYLIALTLGVLKDVYTLDIDTEAILNQALLAELTEKWQWMEPKSRKRYLKLKEVQ